jgi:hypothetical protein
MQFLYASKKIEKWIEAFIDLRYYELNDYADFTRLQSFRHLPPIDEAEFGNVVELIMTLE